MKKKRPSEKKRAPTNKTINKGKKRALEKNAQKRKTHIFFECNRP